MSKIFGAIITLFFFISCCTAKDNLKNQVNYEVLISFNSIGTGVPDPTSLVNFIKSFKSTYTVKNISADKIGPLGREGEFKLGFSLKELNADKKSIFIVEVEKIVSTLNDRGNAHFERNGKVDFSSIGERATRVKIMY